MGVIRGLRSRQGGGQHDLARFSPKGAVAVTYYGSDSFTGTDATTLVLHTPTAVSTFPAATSWTEENGTSPTVQLLNNRVVNNTAAGGTHRLSMNSGVTPTDHSVTADFTFFTNLGAQDAIVARMTGGGSGVGGYYLIYNATLQVWQLHRITDAFADTQLGSNQSYAFPVSGTTVAVEIRCVGGNVKCYVGGALILDQTDGSPLTGTKAGVYFISNGTAPAAGTGVHIDNLVIRSPS